MTSYLSSLSSHYSSLKRLLPTALSSDTDLTIANTEDSHVSRVLRAYYTEKGRPFPPWLGPDPNAPQKAPVKPALSTSTSNTSTSSGAGSLRAQRGAGGLGDLFADSSSQQLLQPESSTSSLRAGRRPAYNNPAADSIPYPQRQQPQHAYSSSSSSLNLSKARSADTGSSQATARPLPSQRLGSYQTRTATPPAGPKELSAQERLKLRLGGGRSGSPSSLGSGESTPTSAGYDPYNYNKTGAGGPNPYSGSSGTGDATAGSSFNPYESTAPSQYDSASSGRQNRYAAVNDAQPVGNSGGWGFAQSGTGSSGAARYSDRRGGVANGDSRQDGNGLLDPNTARRGPGLPSSPRRAGR